MEGDRTTQHKMSANAKKVHIPALSIDFVSGVSCVRFRVKIESRSGVPRSTPSPADSRPSSSRGPLPAPLTNQWNSGQGQARDVERLDKVTLKHEVDLENGVTAWIALCLDGLHNALKRHVLISERVKHRFTNSHQQSRKDGSPDR